MVLKKNHKLEFATQSVTMEGKKNPQGPPNRIWTLFFLHIKNCINGYQSIICTATKNEAKTVFAIFTLGGSDFRKLAETWLLLPNPAEAKFKVAGSEMLFRFHLRAESPPLSITRLDIPVIPLAGLPYLKIKNTTRKSHFEKGMLPCYSQDLKYHTEEGIAITYGYW